MSDGKVKKWPPEVDEAIWALLCEGHYPTAITRILNAGPPNSPLPEPCAIKRGTVIDKAAKLRKERGEPATYIAEGREKDAAGSLRRKALDVARGEIEKLEAKAERDELTDRDVRKLVGLAKLVDDIEARLGDRERENPHARGGRKGTQAPDLYETIANAERERARTPAPVDVGPAPGDTSP